MNSANTYEIDSLENKNLTNANSLELPNSDEMYFEGPKKILPKQLVELKLSAAKGDVTAQYSLGTMYHYGQTDGVDQNYSLAITYYKLASLQHHAGALTNLGLMHDFGMGVEQNTTIACQYYEKAKELKNTKATKILSEKFENSIINKKSPKALAYYLEAAAKGETKAQKFLGDLYLFGQGVGQDDKVALMFYESASLQGYSPATANLAVIELINMTIAKLLKKHSKQKYISLAVQQGNIDIINALGNMYWGKESKLPLLGKVLLNGLTLRNESFLLSNEETYYSKGNPIPTTIYGLNLSQRIVGIKNDSKYAKYISFPSHYLINRYNYIIPVDQKNALKYFKYSANLGDVYGQVQVADLYIYGTIIKQNYFKAFNYFSLAAAQGDAYSQTQLGDMYYYGMGIEKSQAKAHEHYQLAATQGDAYAKLNLLKEFDHNVNLIEIDDFLKDGNGVKINNLRSYLCYLNSPGRIKNSLECFENYIISGTYTKFIIELKKNILANASTEIKIQKDKYSDHMTNQSQEKLDLNSHPREESLSLKFQQKEESSTMGLLERRNFKFNNYQNSKESVINKHKDPLSVDTSCTKLRRC